MTLKPKEVLNLDFCVPFLLLCTILSAVTDMISDKTNNLQVKKIFFTVFSGSMKIIT